MQILDPEEWYIPTADKRSVIVSHVIELIVNQTASSCHREPFMI